jgi:hypothetical protein
VVYLHEAQLGSINMKLRKVNEIMKLSGKTGNDEKHSHHRQEFNMSESA